MTIERLEKLHDRTYWVYEQLKDFFKGEEKEIDSDYLAIEELIENEITRQQSADKREIERLSEPVEHTEQLPCDRCDDPDIIVSSQGLNMAGMEVERILNHQYCPMCGRKLRLL